MTGKIVTESIVIVLAVGFWALAREGAHGAPPELEGFRKDFLRLRVAVSEGVAPPRYSDLLLETATDLELARPWLQDSKERRDSEAAVRTAETAQAVWQESFQAIAFSCS